MICSDLDIDQESFITRVTTYSERPHTAKDRGCAANGLIGGLVCSGEVPVGGGLLAAPVLASGLMRPGRL